MTPLLLIDLGSLAYPIYAQNQDGHDPNLASRAIVDRVRALAYDHPHAAVCCDSGRCFRHDLAADYKGQRAERDAVLQHQITLTQEQLVRDGFPVWSARGYEADDVIATAVRRALTETDWPVLIVTGDKDLLQLVTDRVTVKRAQDGALMTPEAVGQRLGVSPAQIVDYLSLVGDAADNVKGAERIGAKTAATLLAKWRTLDALYEELAEVGAAAMGLTPSVAKSLRDFAPRLAQVRTLIRLKDDAEIPFAEVLTERTAAPHEEDDPMPNLDAPETPGADLMAVMDAAEPAPTPPSDPPPHAANSGPNTSLAVQEPPEVLAPAPADYERQLDPRSPGQALKVAQILFQSKMFEGYGSPQAVLTTIMVGRELGLPVMTSLRCIHNIKGRHALSAQLIVALVLKSGICEYFDLVELDDTHCIYEAKRKTGRTPVRITHTVEMAQKAGLWKPDSNWVKSTQDMLVARASVRLARIVAPEIVANVYTPEELQEIREARGE